MNKIFIGIRKKCRALRLFFTRQRSSISTSSASAQVLYNPELLENIMIYLPERDLLVNAQRVNRLWRSIITTFSTLQQKLYFLPIPPTKDNAEGIVNPILLELFPPWFKGFERNTSRASINRDDFRNLDWNSSIAKREAYRRKDASWRHMLVIQPPISRLSGTLNYGSRCHYSKADIVGTVILDSIHKGKGRTPEGM